MLFSLYFLFTVFKHNDPLKPFAHCIGKKGYLMLLAALSYLDSITVHAPHPPSPQLNLVPVSRTGTLR